MFILDVSREWNTAYYPAEDNEDELNEYAKLSRSLNALFGRSPSGGRRLGIWGKRSLDETSSDQKRDELANRPPRKAYGLWGKRSLDNTKRSTKQRALLEIGGWGKKE